MSRHRLLACGLGASLAALVLLTLPGAVAASDRHVYDWLSRFAAGAGTPSGRVAVVAIDDRSLHAVGPWPWSHRILSRLIDRLDSFGATVIALDAVLESPAHEGGFLGAEDPDETDAVVASIHRSRVVVGHAMSFGGPSSNALSSPCIVLPAEASPPTDGDTSVRARLFQPVGVDCSAPELTGAASASGFLNLGADEDGVVRRLPVVMSYRDHTVPSLALAAVQLAGGGGPPALADGRGHPLVLRLDDGRPVPLGERGTMALRFRALGAHPRLSAADVLDGRADRTAVQGRIVFVGTTTVSSPDLVRTAFNGPQSRLDLHATAADNLLQRDSIANMPHARAVTVLATLALGPLAAWLMIWLGFKRGAIASATLLVALWVAAVFAMRSLNAFMSPALPSLALLGAVGAASLARLGRERYRDDEQRRRQQAQEMLVQSLMTMVELRDPLTGRHARRTQGYCRLLAQRLAHVPGFREYLTPERIEFISWLAPLHDIGKVGIRDAVLGKTSALSDDELNEMRRHPIVGFEAISRAQRQVGMDSAHDDALLQIAKDIVYTHHERWDGHGYPRGLHGQEIPIPGRIVAVVDVYDALVEARPYRRRIPHQEAVTSITEGRGTQFDPEVVDAFLMVSSDFLELGTRLREEAVAG
mgnify:CR=1 FL=1